MAIRLEVDARFMPPGPSLSWMSQAGFWIDTGTSRLLIDPYLSDSLARKYDGTAFPHIRMMEPPITPETLPRPDLVLITHAHTDHMDPDTLAPLARRFPDLPFIVPAAEEKVARERIGQRARLVTVTAGARLTQFSGIEILVTPAAHEARKQDAMGQDHFLGFAMADGGVRLAHPGDTIPLPSLEKALLTFRPKILLLPVNGRDPERASNGIPGNLTLAEAVALSERVGADAMVPHHWGMFDFSSADPAEIDAVANSNSALVLHRPSIRRSFRIIL